MKLKLSILSSIIFVYTAAFGSDTLYFRLSNPWNTVKSPIGAYLRKCVKENDYYHSWDYNSKNVLVTESFYSDTNFSRKLFCHKYFNEKKGYLEQSRCYENGRLSGYFVAYNEKGDTTSYQLYNNGEVIKEWSAVPQDDEPPFIIDEEPATFPGGEGAWRKYISDHLRYPDSLQQVKGQVTLRFVIDPTGAIKNVEIIKSLHPLLDKEAIRVLLNAPKWKPARQGRKKVHAIRTQPITFE